MSLLTSDRQETVSAEYTTETNIRQVLPKTKKVLFSNFLFLRHFYFEKKFTLLSQVYFTKKQSFNLSFLNVQ